MRSLESKEHRPHDEIPSGIYLIAVIYRIDNDSYPVSQHDLDFLRGDDDVCGSAVGVDDHINLALIHGDCYTFDDVRRESEVPQLPLDLH